MSYRLSKLFTIIGVVLVLSFGLLMLNPLGGSVIPTGVWVVGIIAISCLSLGLTPSTSKSLDKTRTTPAGLIAIISLEFVSFATCLLWALGYGRNFGWIAFFALTLSVCLSVYSKYND